MARKRITTFRALIEITAILFLFYANLLMGEFTGHAGVGKPWLYAFRDIITTRNFLVGFISAVIGFLGFELLRERA